MCVDTQCVLQGRCILFGRPAALWLDQFGACIYIYVLIHTVYKTGTYCLEERSWLDQFGVTTPSSPLVTSVPPPIDNLPFSTVCRPQSYSAPQAFFDPRLWIKIQEWWKSAMFQKSSQPIISLTCQGWESKARQWLKSLQKLEWFWQSFPPSLAPSLEYAKISQCLIRDSFQSCVLTQNKFDEIC